MKGLRHLFRFSRVSIFYVKGNALSGAERTLKRLDTLRPLLLDVAITFLRDRRRVVMMCPLPRLIIWHFAERLYVERAPGEREHRNRLADPHIMLFQPLLEAANLAFVIVLGQDQVRLHPRN